MGSAHRPIVPALTRAVRVFVVDDAQPFLRAILPVVAATPGFELVGTAATAGEALVELATRDDVDLVLLDVHLPDLNGIEATRRYRAAGGTAVIILMSTSEAHDLPLSTVRGDVAGFLPKESLAPSELTRLWEAVAGRS